MLTIKNNIIWIALLLTLFLVYFTANMEEDAAETLLPPQRNQGIGVKPIAHIQPAPIQTAVETLPERSSDQRLPINIFTSFHTMLAPKPTQTDALSEPVVSAHIVNPYRYEGRVIDQGQSILFITDGVQNFSVKQGDLINKEWRVLRIMPSKVILRYVPQKVDVEMLIES